jgi:predicted O-linked N-acetylglucosamine transferase (SPINDLY family)
VDLRTAIELQAAGRFNEAEASCRVRLQSHPSDAATLHLLARLVRRRGARDEALELMFRAVHLSPASPQLRVDLGGMLGDAGRPADAIPHFMQALRVKGDIPELHNNLGVALEALGRIAEAAAAFRNAIRFRPDYAGAHNNLGNALRKLGRLHEAASAYRDAVRLRPGGVNAMRSLGSVAADVGELDEIIRCYRALAECDPAAHLAHSGLLYTLHYDPEYDGAALYREHLEWARRHAEPVYRKCGRPHDIDGDPDRRLRVGYVSPDFRDHTVPRFIGAALEHQHRERFEVFLYSDAVEPDAVTARLRGLGHAWRETVKLADEPLERLIRQQDRIDILVDLRGHAANNQMTLFARKPAPVQVTMVGYFDTTGLPTMDWRVTDDAMDPPGHTERYHTEKLARLPHGCWCYSPDADAPDVTAPPAVKNGYVTFGSLNKIVKVTPPCARAWAAVLEAVPRSRLLLAAPSADSIPAVRQRLATMGLTADRLDLLDKTRTRREYLERFGRIDVALDTFPFNGITTTCDGLWMGVPAVSLAGSTSVSRAGRSILRAAGLGELAVDTPDAFVRAAAALGDAETLRRLRRTMRDRLGHSPLMDGARFTANLEAAYRRMWRERCPARGAGSSAVASSGAGGLPFP